MMTRRSRGGRSKGRVARSVVDTILGEAVGERKGFKPTREQRYNDMLRIASVVYNRSVQTGLPPDQMLTQKEFNAYRKALPGGVEAYRSIAQQAWDYVNLYGPVTKATFYATPAAVKNLPKGLKPADETVGHKYFTDPQARPIGTQKGYKGPAKAPQTLPSRAPVPSSRPLDSIGGLGALAVTGSRVAPSSLAAPVGERFGQASPASPPAPSRFGAVAMQDDLAMQAQPRSPPMGAVSGPLGPAPATRSLSPASVESPQLSQQKRDMQAAYDKQIGQSQRFRPSAAPAPAAPAPLAAAPVSPVSRAALAPATRSMSVPTAAPNQQVDTATQRVAAANTMNNMLAGRNMPVSPAPAAPAPAAQKSYYDPAKEYAYAGLTRSLAPAAPVGSVATPATAAPAAAQYVGSSPKRSIATAPAPAPSRFGTVAMQDDVAMAPQPASPPLGSVTAPFGPANAPPAALDAARNLGTAVGAYAVERTPAAQAQELSTTPETAFDTQPAAPARTPAAAAVRAAATARPGGIPSGVPGPWGADIANQQPAVDRMTTQSTQQPTTFGEKLTNLAQRYGPQIAGTLVAGPVGGLIGGIVGRSFDAAQPGQLLGNPFQGLGNTAKAMGMFQSGTPYAGPISNYGTGLKAIGSVLGGQAPVGSRAYSRSTPGYHVTALPGGTIQRTNQYGFTSFERPSMGPTGSSFPGGFSGGFGGFFGGRGGQGSGKTSGGRTSGGKSSSKSGGGRKSERSESAGY